MEENKQIEDQLSGAALDVLLQISKHGPAEPNDLPSKTGVDELLYHGFATRIALNDIFGYIALTERGFIAANGARDRLAAIRRERAVREMMEGPAMELANYHRCTEVEKGELEEHVKLAIDVSDNAFETFETIIHRGPLTEGTLPSRSDCRYLMERGLVHITVFDKKQGQYVADMLCLRILRLATYYRENYL